MPAVGSGTCSLCLREERSAFIQQIVLQHLVRAKHCARHGVGVNENSPAVGDPTAKGEGRCLFGREGFLGGSLESCLRSGIHKVEMGQEGMPVLGISRVKIRRYEFREG